MHADQQMLIVYQIVYYNAMVLAKLSYLFFYLRIFVTEAFRLAAWICMGCALTYWLGSMLQIFLICQPFAKNWDTSLEGHCASQNVAFSTIGAFNLVTDLLIMLLPVHFVRKLQMSPATKLGLYMIFCLGFLYVSILPIEKYLLANKNSISAITIIRIRVLTTVDFTDLPYSMIWAAFWSVAEPALAVTNSCIPMLRPVLKAFFPSLFSSARDRDYSSQTGPSVGSSLNFHRRRNIDDTDGEMPLTQLQEGAGKWSRSGDEASLNERLQEGHSATHLPRSVIEN